MSLRNLKLELRTYADPNRAKLLQGFFKTGVGEYGEGDIFIGVTVPDSRKIVRKYSDIALKDVLELLQSRIHEERLVALLLMVDKFSRDDSKRSVIYKAYIKNIKKINNWDLVDSSAPKIVGKYLLDKPRSILYKLAKSNSVWKKRVAVIATFSFIENNQLEDTIAISKILLRDRHDLIHKAVGWALREVGKINLKEEEDFLKLYCKIMPRTMLRYAIEKFPEPKRKKYLSL